MKEVSDGANYYAWESMPLSVQNKIKAATDYVEGHDDPSKLPRLNRFLDRKGYIGRKASLRSTKFIAIAEIRLAADIVIEPVLDADILRCSQFEGRFVGCGVEELEDTGLYVTYNVQFDHPDGRLITIKAFVDVSDINFTTTESGPEEDISSRIAQAFEVLSDTDNNEYHEVVTSLREAFFDKELLASGPAGLASRLRTIGVMSTFLLAQEDHSADARKISALGEIIDESLDTSCHYTMTGIEFRHEVDEGNVEHIRAYETTSPLVIDISGYTYVRDVEVSYTENGEIITTPSTGIQPAFVAIDIERNRLVTLPLRGFKSLEEISGHVQTLKDFLTCGDKSRAYDKQVALGRIASTGSFLEKYR